MQTELGLIEGFYGKPWSWQEREDTIAFLAQHARYESYLYAPKADPFLRRRWQERHPGEMVTQLAQLSERCKKIGVRFGIGLSPYDIFLSFDTPAKDALAQKLAFFDEIGIHDLAILFDDMRGDVPQLAEKQAEIVQWAAARTRATRLLVCPSYYTDDPVLDRVFGQRPPRYLKDLGQLLDPKIEMFWTGEEVCSREFSVGHLQRVTEEMGRKPFLWDNYPVNDGQRMSQFLHVRGFTGRPAEIQHYISAHGINPALQPTLTRIPALTLRASYEQGNAYEYGAAQLNASIEVLGDDVGSMVHDDTLVLQDVGLDRLAEREKVLRERYTNLENDGAREIIAWLDGAYRITNEIVQTQ